MKTKVAILGSGNIGTDLMIKVLRTSKTREMGGMVGGEPNSEGRAPARRMGFPIWTGGIKHRADKSDLEDVRITFDAAPAKAHARHSEIARNRRIQMVDLTPAAAGP